MNGERHENRIFCLVLLCMGILALVGCKVVKKPWEAEVIQDLVYTKGKDEVQYTVYLPEGDLLKPYLVLSDQYDGACLLLRKNLLNETAIYNPNKRYSAYYEDSAVDQMLNETFLQRFPAQMAEDIPTVDITISCKESLWGGGKQVTSIPRKIFLLSATEVGYGSSGTILEEGDPLAYFSDDNSRIACFENGVAESWWLRTPNVWYDTVVCGVDTTGKIGIGGTGSYGQYDYQSGVRPALCLPADMPVCLEDGHYVLSRI